MRTRVAALSLSLAPSSSALTSALSGSHDGSEKPFPTKSHSDLSNEGKAI